MGCRLMNEIVDMIMMIATTIIISSRVKPLVRRVRCDGLIRRFFIPCRTATPGHSACNNRQSECGAILCGPPLHPGRLMLMVGTFGTWVKVPGYTAPSYNVLQICNRL